MMLQFRFPTPIILYYFVLFARSRQTGRSYKSIPDEEEVLVVVVLRIVLDIVPGVAAILQCFFRSWARAAIIRLTELTTTKPLISSS
jgi:hypothetical protein